MSWQCQSCGKNFSAKFNLNKHKRTVHEEKPRTASCDCLECGVHFKFIGQLREHLINAHEFQFIVKNLKFNSMTEFESWLVNEEKVNHSRYVKLRGAAKTSKSTEKIYFNCHQSGAVRTKPSLNKKQDKYCTSEIILVRDVETDFCKVQYYPDHYAHKTGEKCIILSNELLKPANKQCQMEDTNVNTQSLIGIVDESEIVLNDVLWPNPQLCDIENMCDLYLDSNNDFALSDDLNMLDFKDLLEC